MSLRPRFASTLLIAAASMIVLPAAACGENRRGGEASAAQAQATPRATAPRALDVPYVPTRTPVVDKMLEMAEVGPNDYVIDLGSGDGRIVVAAVRDRGARGYGVDLNPQRVREAEENARRAGVADRARFEQRDLFETPIAEATVLTMYLLPEVNLRLRPRILEELRPGTRVVSHAFHMGEWEHDRHERVDGANVYLWIVPARVEGAWTVEGAEGLTRLELNQSFQRVTGVAVVDGRRAQLRSAELRGDRLRAVVDTPRGPRLLAARVQGEVLTPDGEARREPGATTLQGWRAARGG